jgi:hypothetical protein
MDYILHNNGKNKKGYNFFLKKIYSVNDKKKEAEASF